MIKLRFTLAAPAPTTANVAKAAQKQKMDDVHKAVCSRVCSTIAFASMRWAKWGKPDPLGLVVTEISRRIALFTRDAAVKVIQEPRLRARVEALETVPDAAVQAVADGICKLLAIEGTTDAVNAPMSRDHYRALANGLRAEVKAGKLDKAISAALAAMIK